MKYSTRDNETTGIIHSVFLLVIQLLCILWLFKSNSLNVIVHTKYYKREQSQNYCCYCWRCKGENEQDVCCKFSVISCFISFMRYWTWTVFLRVDKFIKLPPINIIIMLISSLIMQNSLYIILSRCLCILFLTSAGQVDAIHCTIS